MAASELLELVQKKEIDSFELRCMELLEGGQLTLSALVEPFQALPQVTDPARVASLTQMVLGNSGGNQDAQSGLEIGRAALGAAPDNAQLRALVLQMYAAVYGQRPEFARILEASGLERGRPAIPAMRVLDLCLELKEGAALISRTDDRVVEVEKVDTANSLFTLRGSGRTTTIPAGELAREYERIDVNDFRALRHLHPERLPDLIENDPLTLIIGLVRAHGDLADVEVLKHELVPRFIDTKEWSRWWTRVRGRLKHCPNLVLEGRAPVVVRYVRQARRLEDETLATFQAQNDPLEWLSTVEGYIRAKSSHKQTTDPALLAKFAERIAAHIPGVRARRPAEALTAAFVLERLADRNVPVKDNPQALIADLIRTSSNPSALLRALEQDWLWEKALDVLPQARPDTAAADVLKLMPAARAAALDQIVTIAANGGKVAELQAQIDAAMSDPVHHAEIMYWLWKGPQPVSGLRFPQQRELFSLMLDTLTGLGRGTSASDETIKSFRHRIKAALGLRDFAPVRECLAQIEPAAAVGLRRQIERVEGLGDNVPSRMLELLRVSHPDLWVRVEKRQAPWEADDVLWSTAEGIRRKIEERDHLLNVTMRENAQRIGEAASHGDLSENSEYKFALEERDLLRARLAQMNNDLSLASPIETHDVPEDHVGVGARVTLRSTADQAERELTFLGPFDTDVDKGILNYKAPLSLKLMGLHVGDRAKLALDGHELEYEIVAIRSAFQPTRS